jgi:putative Ig domain-containing protein
VSSTNRLLLTLWGGLALQGCYSPDVVWTGPDTEVGSTQPAGAGGAGGAGGSIVRPGPGGTGSGGVPQEPEPVLLTIDTQHLPSPCSNVAYRAQLHARGGVADSYTWSAVSALPSGLSLSSEGEIEGIPLAEGAFSVRVSDEVGNESAVRDLSLSWRKNCWFAYLAAEDGSVRLNFRDVFLDPRTHVTLPAGLPEGDGVADFKVSPDGSWIGLRIGTPEQYRLAIYSTKPDVSGALLRDVAEVPFCSPTTPAPACSVLDYAWSADSQYLAVVLSGAAPGQDYLSGLDVSRPAEPWSQQGTAAWDLGTVAIDYREQLVWVGSEWIAFLGADLGSANADSLSLYTAALGADRTSIQDTWNASGYFGVDVSLSAAPSGVVFGNAAAGQVTFFRRLGQTFFADVAEHSGVVSPSRQTVATIAEGARLEISTIDAELPFFTSVPDTCSEVIAWSTQSGSVDADRLACWHEGKLRIFDYSTEAGQLSLVREVPFTGELTGVRRAFSSSGRWFLYGDPAGRRFTIVDANSQAEVEYLPFVAQSALQFAPGRDAVALSDARILMEFPLPQGQNANRSFGTQGGRAPVDLSCEDSFARNPSQWCGASAFPNRIKYGANGESLLFEGPAGVLTIADMTLLVTGVESGGTEVTSSLPPCSEDCANSYQFIR